MLGDKVRTRPYIRGIFFLNKKQKDLKVVLGEEFYLDANQLLRVPSSYLWKGQCDLSNDFFVHPNGPVHLHGIPVFMRFISSRLNDQISISAKLSD